MAHSRLIAVAILAVSLTPPAWLILSNRDVPQFGVYQDGELLFTNAKSLSEGTGFRQISLPGRPYQTKYQPLEPVLLSAIWKFDPAFPENLKWLAAFQWLAFAAFVCLAAVWFGAAGFSCIEAASLAGFLAMSPMVIYWATVPNADYLFAAVAMAACTALRKTGGRWLAVAGVLAAAAYLTKAAGIVLVPAAAMLLVWRRNWRGLIYFVAPVVPAIGAWTLWERAHRAAMDHPVWWYYTDYVGAFLKNGSLNALPRILSVNSANFIESAGSVVMHDLGESLAGRFVCVLVVAAMVTGAIRLWKRAAEYPVFCAMLAALLCVWNFSPNVRLMLPLTPLIAAGLYLELRRFGGLVRSALHTRGSNFVAACVLTAAVTLGWIAAEWRNARFIFETIPTMMARSREQNRRMEPMLAWMRASLPAGSVVLAYPDTVVYLSTGLASVRAVPDSVAMYRQDRAGMLDDFVHFDRFASAFGITHILVAPGDPVPDLDADQQGEIRALLVNGRREIHEVNSYRLLEVGSQELLSRQ